MELLGLALVLLAWPGGILRLLVGVPLLAHVGYTALTSLPMGAIPGRPEGSKQYRRNLDLRAEVVGFLNEVRRVEEFAQRSHTGGIPEGEMRRRIRPAQQRLMASAARVTNAVGRVNAEPPEERKDGTLGASSILTHARTVQPAARA